MCRPHAKTVAAEGGHNNEIGLPLTLTRIEPDTELVICEMGMRGLGQIAELCAVARPDVAVITSIGPVHLELLGTVETWRRRRRRSSPRCRRRHRGRPRRAAARAVPRAGRHHDRALRPESVDVVRAIEAGAGSGSTRGERSSSSSRSRRGTRRRTRRRAARGQALGLPLPAGRSTSSSPAGAARSRRSRRRPADQRRVQREPDLDARRARAPREHEGRRSRSSARWPSSARRAEYHRRVGELVSDSASTSCSRSASSRGRTAASGSQTRPKRPSARRSSSSQGTSS
jgi:hypothetical protein